MTAEAVPIVLDLGSVFRTVRKRLTTLAIGVAAGALVAAGIVFFVTPRFDGRAMILIRTSTSDPTSLVKGRLGAFSELMPSGLGMGGGEQELATELTLLQSRAVLGAVVDSLHLQAVPESPNRVPPGTVIDSLSLPFRFKPEKIALIKGKNAFAGGFIFAKQAAEVKLLDREDAIDDLGDRLTVRKSGGETVEIRYKARDSVSAARVPNLLAAVYISRRRTVDRGLNQRRLEFLTAKSDSVRLDLRRSADVLAGVAQQNGSGTTPEIAGKSLADEIGSVEAKQSEVRAAQSALDSLILSVQGRHVDARLLAGFPDLLRSPAINDLISQMARVETERTVLLATRPETAPQVIAYARARDSLAAQLLPIAIAYRESLRRQSSSVQRDLDRLYATLHRLPAQTAAVVKEQAEVTRLAQMNAGMGAQVLEARLAAMLEGGDVRLIDEAVAPRRVTFPRPLLTMAGGIAAGFIAALVIVLLGVPVEPARLDI